MTSQTQDRPTALEGTLLGIDSSSWVSWTSYYVGFVAGGLLTPGDTLSLSWGQAGVLTGAVALFFASILLIQRHMKFSLLANTYGSPNHLVTDGVFAYSRNPIYVAFFAPLASLSVISPIAAVIAVVVYIPAMNRFVISREERVLEESFGTEYVAFKSRTRRWL